MFRNWRSIFTGDGGPINARIPIYSFDGRDVLADPFWSVSLIDYFIGCLVLYVLLYSPFCTVYPSGPRRASGTAPPAGVTECRTNTVRRGGRTTCRSWASRRAWPRVCSWASRRGAAPTSTSFFASRPTRTFKTPPAYHSTNETHPSRLNARRGGGGRCARHFFRTSLVLRVTFRGPHLSSQKIIKEGNKLKNSTAKI